MWILSALPLSRNSVDKPAVEEMARRLRAQGFEPWLDEWQLGSTRRSAINGLGTIVFFELELDAAGFFQRRAIELAKKRTGARYGAVEHDLDMALRLRAQLRGPQ
jgi:hypothetical protein